MNPVFTYDTHNIFRDTFLTTNSEFHITIEDMNDRLGLPCYYTDPQACTTVPNLDSRLSLSNSIVQYTFSVTHKYRECIFMGMQ